MLFGCSLVRHREGTQHACCLQCVPAGLLNELLFNISVLQVRLSGSAFMNKGIVSAVYFVSLIQGIHLYL